MGNIRVLDKLISNMIAAGEVVERASSVVKELFENSLDAKASRITVEIKDGGREYIKITDDGCGMDKDDASLCVVRYATSKLKDKDGLYSIKTMGFRGEALASICAVSKVTIDTRKEDTDAGTHIKCEGGEITEVTETGCPKGTSITVENLFYNTPARLKFMKKPQTEASYIEELLGKLILANPQVSVRFIKDGREIFYSKGDGDLKSAVYCVYGRTIAENIIEVDYERDGVKINGCIGNPNIAKPTLKYETFCVNGRICRTKTLVSALEYGYFQKIAQGKHPFCAVNIGIDYSLCDVNIHPQKAEVKFSDEGLIYRVLSEAVSNALNSELYVRHTEPQKIVRPEYRASEPTGTQENIFGKTVQTEPPKKEEYNVPFKNIESFMVLKEKDKQQAEQPEFSKPRFTETVIEIPIREESQPPVSDIPEPKKEDKAQIPPYRIVGQVFKTYIIIETDEEMLMLDQHAAHERMNYEMLRENSKKGTASQMILTPKMITLSPSDFSIAVSETEVFNKLGFDIEPFGENSIVVRSVPMNIRLTSLEKLVYEIINETEKSGGIHNEEFNQRMLYMIACKMSIKANTALSEEEADTLVKRAFELRGNTTCPHGRPLFISFSKSFIEGKFER